MSQDFSDIQRRYVELRDHYADFIHERLSKIEFLIDYLRGSDAPASNRLEGSFEEHSEGDALTDMYRIVHTLQGSAKRFEYERVAEESRALEDTFYAWFDGDLSDRHQLLEEVESYCQSLRDALFTDSTDSPTPHSTRVPNTRDRGEAVILVVTSDEDLNQRLQTQLDAYGYEVIHASHPEDLDEYVRRHDPALITIDVAFPDHDRAGLEAIEELSNSLLDDIPVVFTSQCSSMEVRLDAVQAGGEGFFVKPVELSMMAERVGELTSRHQALQGRALLVDEDELLRDYITTVLGEEGMEVTALEDPTSILESIREHPPDLLLIDLYLSERRGDEIAAVLRQQEIDIGVPIIFISGEISQDRQNQALMRGGDDFLVKPIEADELIDTVRFQLTRSYRIRRKIHVDGLTKVYNHSYLKERLVREVDMSRRNDTAVSLAMLDLDDFKEVNDTWGHHVGDDVLRMLANLLRSRLRSTDIVGRYGGEEFAIILPDTDAEGARHVLEELRNSFAELEYIADGEAVDTTFTYGIATCEGGDREPDELWERADRAMYEGKDRGKNCGLVANTSTF